MKGKVIEVEVRSGGRKILTRYCVAGRDACKKSAPSQSAPTTWKGTPRRHKYGGAFVSEDGRLHRIK